MERSGNGQLSGKKKSDIVCDDKVYFKKIHMLILPNFDLLGRRTGSLVAMFIEKARESWSSKPYADSIIQQKGGRN